MFARQIAPACCTSTVYLVGCSALARLAGRKRADNLLLSRGTILLAVGYQIEIANEGVVSVICFLLKSCADLLNVSCRDFSDLETSHVSQFTDYCGRTPV